MKQKPRIEHFTGKTFVGKKLDMSFAENKTAELWRSFMPMRKEIENSVGIELYSIEVFPPGFFIGFSPQTTFEKWAAVEVPHGSHCPESMQQIGIGEGLYAVFTHRGPASSGPVTYQYIFQTWLPNSDFELDNRAHFAVMDERYKQEDPSSEEELWIPVCKK